MYTTITRNINFIQKRGQLIDYYNALGHIQYHIFIVELINLLGRFDLSHILYSTNI